MDDAPDPAHDAAREAHRIRRSTLVFAAATMLSRVAGLVREMATAALFGASTMYSAFIVANQVPNLLRSLVADSALSAAFVPVFTELRVREEHDRAWRLAGSIIGVIILVLGPLCVLAMVVAPFVVRPFVSDTFSAGDIELTVQLMRLLMPIVLVLALSGVIVGILNAHDRFGAAAIAPVAWNAVILAALAVAAVAGPESWQIWIYAAGMLVGTVVQAVLPVPWLRGLGGRLSIRVDWRDPRLREVFVLMLPVTISLGLINVQQFAGSLLAASVDAGRLVAGVQAGAGPAILDKAFRIYMLPQGIFSVAVSTVFFPVLARHSARGDMPAFRAAVGQGLRQIIVLLTPSTIFLGVLAVPVTRLLYQYGDFDRAQTTAVALALVGFSAGLVFNGMSLLLIRSFFSLKRTWLPTMVSAATLAANLLAMALTYERWGVLAIALSTSAANLLGVVLMYALLRRITGPLGTRRTLAAAIGAVLLGAAATGIGWAIERAGADLLGTTPAARVLVVTAAAGATGAIYLALAPRLRLVEPGFLGSLLRRRRKGT